MPAQTPPRHGDDGPWLRLDLPGLDFRLEGWSVAGIETTLRVPEWSLAIDCGRVVLPSVTCRHLALTHAHLDHAGGLPGWLGLRSMFRLGPADVYAPAAVCAPLLDVVRIWERLQGVRFDFALHAAAPGDRFALGGGRVLQALPAHHNDVAAVGWAVHEQRHHLRPDLVGRPGPEIAARKRAGEAVTVGHEVTLLATTGDSRASIAAEVAALREALVVLHEVTLLSEEHPPVRAHEGGHTHLADLADSPFGEGARVVVPFHVSQRYDAATARRLLLEALGPRFGERLLPLLPEAPSDAESLGSLQPKPR